MTDDFGKQVEQQIPALRRYARALTRNTVDADDLVQECLVRAIAKQDLFRPETNLRAWLFTLMHNQRVNEIRRSVREGTPLDFNEDHDRGANSNAISSLELRDLRAAIQRLPLEQREAVLLVGLEGMTYEGVAEILCVPIGTVRSRLSRGRDELRFLMGIVESDGHHADAELSHYLRCRMKRPPGRSRSRSNTRSAASAVASPAG